MPKGIKRLGCKKVRLNKKREILNRQTDRRTEKSSRNKNEVSGRRQHFAFFNIFCQLIDFQFVDFLIAELINTYFCIFFLSYHIFILFDCEIVFLLCLILFQICSTQWCSLHCTKRFKLTTFLKFKSSILTVLESHTFWLFKLIFLKHK